MHEVLVKKVWLGELNVSTVLCLGQDFWCDTGIRLPEFQGDFYKFWGIHQIFQILPVIRKFLFIFLFKFELDVERFGSRRGVDDSEVVFAIVLVFCSEIFYP